MNRRFIFVGSESIRFTLSDGQEVILSQGKTYSLPKENAYIAALEAQGYLKWITSFRKRKNLK